MDDIPFLLSIEHSIAYARERALRKSFVLFFALAFSFWLVPKADYGIRCIIDRFSFLLLYFFFFGAPSLG